MGNKHSTSHHGHGRGGSSSTTGTIGGKRKYKVPAHAEPPEPPSQPFVQAVDEDSVYLEWNPPPYDGGCPVFSYFIQFKASSADEYTTMGPIGETSAYVRNLEFGVYNFRIVAENLLGYSDASEPSEDLILGGEECGPSFLKELEDVTTVVEGGVVSFLVRAIAKPTPTYTWYYNDIELVPSPNIEPRGARLTLRSVPKTMQGQIKCRAANFYGGIDTATKLVVGVPPEIKQPDHDAAADPHSQHPHIFARVGEPLRLRFPLSGHPTPAILWTHNGAPAPRIDTQTPQISSVATLKIDNIQREDRGEYELTVQNEFGVDRLSVLVTVADRPAAPRDPPRINLQKDDSCLVEWDNVHDDGGCEVGGYIVEYYRVGWDCWLTGTTTRHKAARLRDLIPGSRYMFRVKAENPYGISEPSPQSGVLFIPDRSSGLMGPLEESIDEEEDNTVSEPTKSTVIEASGGRGGGRKPDWANPKITIEPEMEQNRGRDSFRKVNGVGGFPQVQTPKVTRPTLTAPEEEYRPRLDSSSSQQRLSLSVSTAPYNRSRSPSPSPGSSPRNARRLSATPNALDHYHDHELLPGAGGGSTGGGLGLGGSSSSEGVYGLLKRHSINTNQFPTDTIKVGGGGRTGSSTGGGSSHQIYETDDSEGEASDFGEVIEVKSSLTLLKSTCSIQTSKERLDSGRTSRASLEMDLETAKELLEESQPQTAPAAVQNENQNPWSTYFFGRSGGGPRRVEVPEADRETMTSHGVTLAPGRSNQTVETPRTAKGPEELKFPSRDRRGTEVQEYDMDMDLDFVPVGFGRIALNYGALILALASLFVKYLNLFVSLGMLLVVIRGLWRLE